MNKAEKAVEQVKLDREKVVLKELERHYEYALKGINERLQVLQAAPETQSKVYQKQYQETLKKQVSAILENLHANEYATLDQYMHDAYTTGFVGTMYDLHYQDVPLLLPINQAAILKAVQHDTKLTSPLYDELGIDTKRMSRFISREISRGIASGLTYDEVARNIKNVTRAPLSRAKVIARTEGHRIQQASSQDAAEAAKAKGADIVKQWDSTLDGDTRPNHRQLDGQIRELDKPFEVGTYAPMYPGDFGDPAEDCNCRCVSLKRARAALDEDELKTLRERAEFFDLNKSDSFADFEKKYLKAGEKTQKARGMLIADLQFFAISKDANNAKANDFKRELANGAINLEIRTQKQNEHIAGTKERQRRVEREVENGKVSSYFYEGTDVAELVKGLFGTGMIDFDSEKSLYPTEFITLEKPVGKAYNYGTGEYVDVSRIAIQYSSKGVHAYPVKDW